MILIDFFRKDKKFLRKKIKIELMGVSLNLHPKRSLKLYRIVWLRVDQSASKTIDIKAISYKARWWCLYCLCGYFAHF